MNPIQDKRITLGVTGSIACYKIADLASKLTQAGSEVDVILTKSATYFVHPITFQSVTGRKAYTDEDLWGVGKRGSASFPDLLCLRRSYARPCRMRSSRSGMSLAGAST